MTKKSILLLPVLFLLSYLFFFPSYIFSIDEVSYLSRALAFINGQTVFNIQPIDGSSIPLSVANYPLGTSSLLTLLLPLGKKAVFLSGLLYTILSYLLIRKTLVNNNLGTALPTILFFLFPPLLFFSRSLMSEMPSLLIVSALCYCVFSDNRGIKHGLSIGVLGGLSLWFRETNFLLFIILVIPVLYEKKQLFFPILGGLIIGLLPRLLTSKWVYGSMFYLKEITDFSSHNLIPNLQVYLFVVLILIPGGVFFLYKYVKRLPYSLSISLVLFMIIHLFFDYNARDHSSFLVSVFYNGRYWIPTLPLWMYLYGFLEKELSILSKNGLIIFFAFATGIGIIGLNYHHHHIGQELINCNQEIGKLVGDTPIKYDSRNYKLFNPIMPYHPEYLTSANGLNLAPYFSVLHEKEDQLPLSSNSLTKAPLGPNCACSHGLVFRLISHQK